MRFKKLYFRHGFKVLVANGSKLVIGENCFFNNFCSINCMKEITIGDNCIFGERVSIYDHNHIFNKNGLIMNQGFSKKSVKIGNNCWIGTGCNILAGTTIGDDCVIGAGLTISGNIPADTIVKRNKDSYYLEPIKKESD